MSMAPCEAHGIDTPRGRLHARRWPAPSTDGGALSPVVLFHDSLGSVELWREFPEQLAHRTGRTVIAYDRLGFGRSDPHPGRLPRSFITDEALGGFSAVRAALGIGRFVALGHSVGGCMAAAAAARFPAACEALVTESAQAFIEERTRDGIREAQRLFAQPGQLERLGRYHGGKAAWVLDAWIGTWLSPEFRDWTLDATLRQVRCPVLAIHGDRDEYGSVEHPQRIASRVAGPGQTAILPDCGHIPHREAGERVLARIATWLGSLPPEPERPR